MAVLFAKEGADVAIAYLGGQEEEDAQATRTMVEQTGRNCLLIPGDLAVASHAAEVIGQVKSEFGGLDILVSNAGEQHVRESLEKITYEQAERTMPDQLLCRVPALP